MLTALFLLLLILWLLGFLQLGNNDFLRVVLFTIQDHPIRVLDGLIALVIIWLVIALPGPLAMSAALLAALWGLTLAGIVQIEGIPVNALIILVILVGVLVHLLTRRRVA